MSLLSPPPTVEERHGGVAGLLVTPPGWGQPHPQVDTQPAHQRHTGRLRPGKEVANTHIQIGIRNPM